MAVHLYCLPIVNHILYFLLPDADERLLHPLLAAVTVKPGRHFLQDFQAEFTDDYVLLLGSEHRIAKVNTKTPTTFFSTSRPPSR